jgi:ubiquinone/menaquinone biosynthesis C-methylase UbiE
MPSDDSTVIRLSRSQIVAGGRYTLGHHLLGIEGLALLRSTGREDETARARRVAELLELATRLDRPPYSEPREAPFVEPAAGYAAWAESYDEPGNVTIALEEDVVHSLLAQLPERSQVLDAACGTGRHTAFLAARGHAVIGVDASPEMLERARAKVPGARFLHGELDRLPLDDRSVDAAVCALALSHSRDIRPAVAELARVLRPGGRLVVSNPHPLATGLLGWRATVSDAAGRIAVIPEYPHSHAEYIDAFRAAGLEVRRCVEPLLSAEQAAAEAKTGLTEAFRAALTGFPVVIVWDLERGPATS